MSEDFITLNKRELKLLKAYMGHHGWNGLRLKNKMTACEIDTFRNKIGI